MPLANITVMVQKEVAERMQAEPGTKVWCIVACRAVLRETVSGGECSAKLFYATAKCRQCGNKT